MRFCLVIFFIFGLCLTRAQEHKPDSLLAVWKNTALADTTRLKAVGQLHSLYANSFPDSAFFYAREEYDYAKKKGLKYYEAEALNLMGNILREKGVNQDAILLYQQSLKIKEEIADKKGYAGTLMNLGIVYSELGDNTRALSNYEKSLRLFEEINIKKGVAMALNNMGNLFKEQGQHAKALEYFYRSLARHKEIGNAFGEANSYNNIGSIYELQKKYDEALGFYNKSLALKEKINNRNGMAESLNSIGDIFTIRGDFKKAEEMHLKSLNINKELGFREGLANSFTGLGNIYYKRHLYPEAITYYEKAFSVIEKTGLSLPIMVVSNKLYELYKFSGAYKKALRMHEIYMQNRDTFLNIEKVKQFAGQEARLNYEKQKELDKRQHAADLEKIAAREEKRVLVIYLAGGVLLLFFILIAFAYSRTNLKRKHEYAVKEKEISEYKLMALRAQMNPHFIFNAISTVQYFISENDKKAAYDCISKFSKLIRMVLENSGSSFVSLKDELQILELYVSLEALRFENNLEFDLTIEEKIQPETVSVPSFILQPFVENAILHGLMGKKNNAKISVDITMLEKNELLCRIKDNGIGINRSLELKKRKGEQYKAFGMKITESRLDILNKDLLKMEVKDLFDENNNITGTLVELVMPFKILTPEVC